MLTDEEVEVIASKLNNKIDLSIVNEKVEQIIFVKIVKQFDRLLYQNLPNELYGLVKIASDGISEKEAKNLKSILGARLNSKFDISYVPEAVEQEIFEMLVDLIVDAMKKEYSVFISN
jgi:hydrogenase maturation factor HypE